ncbi:Oxygen-evolving enhancer protein like [Actinidia chinensis var. chinensis]|uniref:Oxygen-evolving enhancer protein like n=1 Tax=Actinidia chinensis var. chinensis TaxID=1590841 RepID=A0A2R6QL74_ACTCC|nr:Oxygen-evolving enhancer protein like [Actinidia chinensis var. chinensis]
MVMAILLSLSPHPPKPHQNPNPSTPKPISLSAFQSTALFNSSRRQLILNAPSLCFLSLILNYPVPKSRAETLPSKSILSGIANTKSWSQFYGDGFAIRVPPQFADITEPEDYNAGLSLYGDKAKPKTFAARFASSDGSEVVSVVIRPSNQLKITFLEAKDITDFGSLKEAARIFVPGGSTLYSARTIKIKEDEGFRTYYFYEFGRDEQHVALVAAVNSGKAFIAGATAPQSKWGDDGVKLRSAAVSLTVL